MHNAGCDGCDVHIRQNGMCVQQPQEQDLDDAIEVREAS